MTGIIIIDYINMTNPNNQFKINDLLRKKLIEDYTKVKIHNMNDECVTIVVRQSRSSKPELK